jgi:hypothetical protein
LYFHIKYLFHRHSWTLEFFRPIVIAMLVAGWEPHPADRNGRRWQTTFVETSAMQVTTEDPDIAVTLLKNEGSIPTEDAKSLVRLIQKFVENDDRFELTRNFCKSKRSATRPPLHTEAPALADPEQKALRVLRQQDKHVSRHLLPPGL